MSASEFCAKANIYNTSHTWCLLESKKMCIVARSILFLHIQAQIPPPSLLEIFLSNQHTYVLFLEMKICIPCIVNSIFHCYTLPRLSVGMSFHHSMDWNSNNPRNITKNHALESQYLYVSLVATNR